MLKSIPLATALILTRMMCCSQHIAVSTGLSVDLNNSGKFINVPVSVQWLPAGGKAVSLVVKVDATFPDSWRRNVSAYTVQAGQPPVVSLEQTIKHRWYGASAGFRIRQNIKAPDRVFFVELLPVGIGRQTFRVDYKNYNKDAYEVLNPDIDLKKTGYFVAAGAGFIMNNFVAQVHVYSPLAVSQGEYKLSYKLDAPLTITIGYQFPYGKKSSRAVQHPSSH